MTSPIEEAIFAALAELAPGKSVAPEAVARAVDPEGWRRLLPQVRATAVGPIRKKAGRTEYQRGIVTRSVNGEWRVRITGAQGSGILRSMSEANGLVVLHHDQANVAAGEWVDVLPFDGLI